MPAVKRKFSQSSSEQDSRAKRCCTAPPQFWPVNYRNNNKSDEYPLRSGEISVELSSKSKRPEIEEISGPNVDYLFDADSFPPATPAHQIFNSMCSDDASDEDSDLDPNEISEDENEDESGAKNDSDPFITSGKLTGRRSMFSMRHPREWNRIVETPSAPSAEEEKLQEAVGENEDEFLFRTPCPIRKREVYTGDLLAAVSKALETIATANSDGDEDSDEVSNLELELIDKFLNQGRAKQPCY